MVPLTVAEDAVFLSAEEATQAIDGMGFEASGALLMRSGRWTANADRAIIDGDLRDPRQVRMHGKPARIVIERQEEEGATVEGHSDVLIFEPGREVLELSGHARVLDNGQSISSESINYRLDSSTFSAGGGAGRVRVVSQPPR